MDPLWTRNIALAPSLTVNSLGYKLRRPLVIVLEHCAPIVSMIATDEFPSRLLTTSGATPARGAAVAYECLRP